MNNIIERAPEKAFGARIKLARNMRDMTQSAVAQRVGVTLQQIQKYEKGDNRIAASRLQQIAQALNCDIAFFYDHSDLEGHLPLKRRGMDHAR